MAWELNGNSNTNPPSDFLGTSDDKPLVIKTNATERVQIDRAGNIGIGTSTPGQKLDIGNYPGRLRVPMPSAFTAFLRKG